MPDHRLVNFDDVPVIEAFEIRGPISLTEITPEGVVPVPAIELSFTLDMYDRKARMLISLGLLVGLVEATEVVFQQAADEGMTIAPTHIHTRKTTAAAEWLNTEGDTPHADPA